MQSKKRFAFAVYAGCSKKIKDEFSDYWEPNFNASAFGRYILKAACNAAKRR
jgi:hypothetical protein